MMEYDGLITKPELDELYHHGILKQKWGVRHGPPYPLDSDKSTGRTVKKGAKVKSVDKSKKADSKSSESESKTTEKKEKNLAQKIFTPSKPEDYSKKQIEEHRNYLIAQQYTKKQREKIKNLPDETIARSKANADNFTKAVLIGTAAIGIAATAYILYNSRQEMLKQIDIKKVMSLNDADKFAELAKRGLTIDSASKLMTLDAGGKLLDDSTVKAAIMDGLKGDLDLVIKNPQFAKTVFGQKMKPSDIHALEYLSFDKTDATKYFTYLRDWGSGSQLVQRQKFQQMFEATTGEIKIPSLSSEKAIIDSLINADPDMEKEVLESLERLLTKAYKQAGYGSNPELIKSYAKGASEKSFQKNSVYATIHALVDHNPELDKKISDAFSKKGYGAIIDTFDSSMAEGGPLWDMPIIALGKKLKLS